MTTFMREYCSEIKFTTLADDKILATVDCWGERQFSFEATKVEQIYPLDAFYLLNKQENVYYLLFDERNKIFPVFQKMCKDNTKCIVVEQEFDDFDIMVTLCHDGVSADFAINTLILEKDKVWYYMLAFKVSPLGKRIGNRVFYDEQNKDLILFSSYPLVINNVAHVIVDGNTVLYKKNNKVCKMVYKNEMWDGIKA